MPPSLSNIWAAWRGDWRGPLAGAGLPAVAAFRERGRWQEYEAGSAESKSSANCFLRYQCVTAELDRVLAEGRRGRVTAGITLPATVLAPGNLDDGDRLLLAELDASYTKSSRKGAAPNAEELYKAARQRRQPADGEDNALVLQRRASKVALQQRARAYPAAAAAAAAAAPAATAPAAAAMDVDDVPAADAAMDVDIPAAAAAVDGGAPDARPSAGRSRSRSRSRQRSSQRSSQRSRELSPLSKKPDSLSRTLF